MVLKQVVERGRRRNNSKEANDIERRVSSVDITA